MVQFFFCKKGEPTVLFSLIGALLPTDFVSSKSKTTFFYSNLNLKKGKKRRKERDGGIVVEEKRLRAGTKVYLL